MCKSAEFQCSDNSLNAGNGLKQTSVTPEFKCSATAGVARVHRPAEIAAFIRQHVNKPEYHTEVTSATKVA